jgi:hypothetical protein
MNDQDRLVYTDIPSYLQYKVAQEENIPKEHVQFGIYDFLTTFKASELPTMGNTKISEPLISLLGQYMIFECDDELMEMYLETPSPRSAVLYMMLLVLEEREPDLVENIKVNSNNNVSLIRVLNALAHSIVVREYEAGWVETEFPTGRGYTDYTLGELKEHKIPGVTQTTQDALTENFSSTLSLLGARIKAEHVSPALLQAVVNKLDVKVAGGKQLLLELVQSNLAPVRAKLPLWLEFLEESEAKIVNDYLGSLKISFVSETTSLEYN